MHNRFVIAFAVVLALTLVACNNPQNRDEIISITDTYLSALVAHDPAAAPLAENIAFVENIQKMSPGEGLWESAVSGPTRFAIYVPDVENQTAGFMGMMTYMAPPPPPPPGDSAEEGEASEEAAEAVEAPEPQELIEQPVLLALRLKLENGKIVEAEHLLAGISSDSSLANLQMPRSGLVAEIPEGERMDHEELIKIGASYYDALDDNDGTLMPFASDCQRRENGMITAGAGAGAGPNAAGTGEIARDCADQLSSKVMTYITLIDNRRVFAADPVTGLAMGLSHFRHAMDTGPYEVINTDGSTRMFEMNFDPFDLPAAHIFKIGADGLVHEIEAMGFMAPYNAPTGWE
ncbi:MAG: hypothetical protein P8Y80_07275 [Acidobacteriota bacterium]|jgi:uncharacterized lipoprotein NlpE involved in copper resistance